MLRSQAITTQPHSWGRAAALAAALLLLAAAPAQAASIYFAGPTYYGFAPNPETDPGFGSPTVGVSNFAFSTGNFEIDGQWSYTAQNPQVAGNSTGFGDDELFIADFTWTVRNTSDTLRTATPTDWAGAHLVLLRVAEWDYHTYSGPLNGVGFDSEGSPFAPTPLIPFKGNGADLLAAVDLGSVPAGGEVSFVIRYNIAGDLLPEGGIDQMIPSIGTRVFFNAVPEPSAGLLMGLGCVIIGAFSRQRRV